MKLNIPRNADETDRCVVPAELAVPLLDAMKAGKPLVGPPVQVADPFTVIDQYSRQASAPPDCPMCALIEHKWVFEAETGLKMYRMLLGCSAHPQADTPVEVRS